MNSEIAQYYGQNEPFFHYLAFVCDLESVQREFKATIPRKRLRDRQDPLDCICEIEFMKDHGMSKFAFSHLLSLTRGQLDPRESCGGISITASQKLSCFLRFLRSASFQRCVGGNRHLKISQSKACRFINEVIHLNLLLPGISNGFMVYILFPFRLPRYLLKCRQTSWSSPKEMSNWKSLMKYLRSVGSPPSFVESLTAPT